MNTCLAFSALVLSAALPVATFALPPQHVVKGPILRVATPAPKHTPCTHPGCPPQPHPTNNHRK